MNIRTFLICTLLSSFLISCGNSKKNKAPAYSITITPKKDLQAGEKLNVSIQASAENTIDSIQYFYSDQPIKTVAGNPQTSFSLQKPLGRRLLSAIVYTQGKSTTVSTPIVLHTAEQPTVYTYKVINRYPHDPHAFTQGLEFYKGQLYEGTGRYGISELRKVDLKTGKVLKSVQLDRNYFGEGISIMNDKIYQLTWREHVGFVYDVNNFKKLKTFQYNKSKQGWGLCNDGKVLYKSDGTNKIWLLNPETLAEESYIEPVTKHALATKVNELEWVKGKIYANTWQKEGVLIINPSTGAVEGIVDFRGLKDKLGNAATADVLNGIAYDQETDKLYVTGKNWDSLFEVELVKK